MANFYVTEHVVGLGTTTLPGAPTADQYTIRGTLTLPTIPQGSSASSSVVVTVINSTTTTTLYTGSAGARGFKVVATLAAGDVITVTTASANSVDQGKQAVKTSIQIWEGIT